MKSISVKVKGTVQGVGYRAFVSRLADDLGLKGMVRNESDGSVYIEAEGNEEALDELVSRCKKGPAWARVSDVDILEKKVSNYQGFTVER